MPATNSADDPIVSEKGVTERLNSKTDDHAWKMAPLTDEIHDAHDLHDAIEKKTDFAHDIDHVAQLGLGNSDELQKKIVRALDTWMLPQLWILYLFNYLNRTNVAQARLNTFDEDLGLQDGDYQVCSRKTFASWTWVVGLTMH